MDYIIEIIFFTFQNPNNFIEVFLLDLCAENFEYYLTITYTIEIWGS